MNEKLNNQFVPYELSLQLKELGFDEPCLYAYDKNEMLYCGSNQNGTLFCILNSNLSTQCAAPLWQQAFNWFKEKYKLYVTTTPIIWSYDTMELAFKLHIAHIKESNEIVCSETYLEEDLQLSILKQLIRCKENLNL